LIKKNEFLVENIDNRDPDFIFLKCKECRKKGERCHDDSRSHWNPYVESILLQDVHRRETKISAGIL
jgi:hypothetical protein